MKRKIIGFFVCMLMIATTVLPVLGGINVDMEQNMETPVLFDYCPPLTKWNITFGEIDYNFEHLVQQTIDVGRIINREADLPNVTVEGLQQPAIDLIMQVSTDAITWNNTASVYYSDTIYFLLGVTNTGDWDLSDVVVTAPNLFYNDDASLPPDEITDSYLKWNLGGLPVAHSVMIVYSITSYYPAIGDDFEADFPAHAEAYYDSTPICYDISFVHLIFKENVFSIDFVKEVSPDGITWNDEATVYLSNPVYFRLTVNNTGNVDFSYVQVMDIFPPEFIIDASLPYIVNPDGYLEWNISWGLLAGESFQIIFYAYASLGAVEIVLQGGAIGYVYPHSLSLPSAMDLDSVSVIILPPTIDFVKEVSPDGITWNDEATVYLSNPVYFRLTVNNTGNVDFSYVQVMDIFPPEFIIDASLPYIVNPDGYLEWNISWGLLAGESFQIIFYANASLGAGEIVLQGGAIGYVHLFPYPAAMELDSVSVIIRPPLPDISVLKEVSADNITYSDSSVTVYKTKPVYFRMTVTNTGNTDLSDVVVSDTLPGFLSYNGDANPPPDSISGHVIDWNLGALTEGEIVVFTFTANASVVGEGDNTVDVNGLFRTTLVSDTDIAHVIVENIPPVADFSYVPLNPSDLDMIQFTDTSYDLAGSIVNWTWNFGDGTISYQQHPTYQYSDDGTYMVTLKVTDDDDAYDEFSKQLVVLNVPPVADLGGPYIGTTDDPINLDGSGSYDSDGTIVSYKWDFGDGKTGTGVNPTHKYESYENYTVTLTVTDDDGLNDTDTTYAIIGIGNPPIIQLNYPEGGEILKDTITIEWFAYDNDDGNDLPIYLFYSDENGDSWYQINDILENDGEYDWDTNTLPDGNYKLLIEAQDSNGNIGFDKSDIFEIKNHEDPQENNPPDKPSKPTGPINGEYGKEYQYTTSTTDIDGDQIYYKWDWGDETSGWIGPYDGGVTITTLHIWDEDGDYEIKVKAKDVHGDESEWSDPLSITMPKNKIFNFIPKILLWLIEHFPFLQLYFKYF